MCVKTCAPENVPYQQVMASGSIMNANHGPTAGFHVAGHVERALIRAQGNVAPVALNTPPSASNIPLLDHLPDGESLPILNEDDGTIAIELDVSGKADFTGTTDTFELVLCEFSQ
jgi:hypothetical protein